MPSLTCFEFGGSHATRQKVAVSRGFPLGPLLVWKATAQETNIASTIACISTLRGTGTLTVV